MMSLEKRPGRLCWSSYLFEKERRYYGRTETDTTTDDVGKSIRIFLKEPYATEDARILLCRRRQGTTLLSALVHDRKAVIGSALTNNGSDEDT